MSLPHRFVFKLLVAAFLLGLSINPAHASACSCAPQLPPAQAYQEKEIIFTGQAASVMHPWEIPGIGLLSNLYASWPQLTMIPGFYQEHTTFTVINSWKGVDTTSVTILTSIGNSMCGISFTSGQQYLVYAYHEADGSLQTNMCSGTTDVANAGNDLAFLNNQPTLSLTPAPMPTWLIVAGITFLVMVALASTWVIYRQSLRVRSLPYIK
jgi:hypothetical protein